MAEAEAETDGETLASMAVATADAETMADAEREGVARVAAVMTALPDGVVQRLRDLCTGPVLP